MAPGRPIARRGERRAAPDERPNTRLWPPPTAEREARRRRPGRVEAGSGTSLAGGGNPGGVERRRGAVRNGAALVRAVRRTAGEAPRPLEEQIRHADQDRLRLRIAAE